MKNHIHLVHGRVLFQLYYSFFLSFILGGGVVVKDEMSFSLRL